MKLYKKEEKQEYVMYQGRNVPKQHFRAFVYNKDEQKLANSWNEYQQLISSGVWFDTKKKAQAKRRRKKKEAE